MTALPNTSLQFKYSLDLHGHPPGQDHAHGAPGALAVLTAQQFHHQFAEAVDDQGLAAEARLAVHHAQGFDQPLDAIEAAKLGLHGGQHGKARLPGGPLAFFHAHVFAHRAGDQRAIGPHGDLP